MNHTALASFADKVDMPHMLIHCPEGRLSQGREMVKAFLRQVYAPCLEELDENVLSKNLLISEGDRGIQFVREQIKPFVQLCSSHTGSFPRFVVLYHADKLTFEAQFALRRLIEDYSKTARFIFVTELMDKIIKPILSRVYCISFDREDACSVMEKKIKCDVDDKCSDVLSHIHQCEQDYASGKWAQHIEAKNESIRNEKWRMFLDYCAEHLTLIS